METRLIRLSGFKTSDPNGRIFIDPELLTPQAAIRTNCGTLSWSDIRFLDFDFRRQTGRVGGYNSSGLYLNSTKNDAGRRLYSILTGRTIFYNKDGKQIVQGVYGPDKKVIHVIKGSMAEKTKYPFLELTGGMSFPDKQGLLGYLVDSDYGTLYRNWKLYVEQNVTTLHIAKMLSRHWNNKIVPSNLCKDSSGLQFDRNDLLALCALYAKRKGFFSIPPSSTITDIFFNNIFIALAATTVPIPDLVSFGDSQQVLDIARNLRTPPPISNIVFGGGNAISPIYGGLMAFPKM